ncbi:MAG: polyphosphate kinase [Opitutae bacterium]|nr:polyphosphate kinase [Opitutae bacterium]
MPVNRKIQKAVFNFYKDIGYSTYSREKKRLQVELLNLQHWVLEGKKRVALVFEGRDAAGKGSTIKRFVENLMPKYLRTVELETPTPVESKRWFHRYEKHLPKPGELVFFDRSWYNRALIEPTMGYCNKSQYKYFMKKVLDWEEDLIYDGVILIKFYLSVDKSTQLYRFEERITDPLKYWKYSKNDQMVRNKWDIFTNYKEQMFARTSSRMSPWVMVNSNNKLYARLTCMLYAISHIDYGKKKRFKPLREEKLRQRYRIVVDGVPFNGLDYRQYSVLKQLTS